MLSSLALNAATFSISFGCVKRIPQAWWFPKVQETVSERCKAFTAAHRSDEDRQAYISASRHVSSVVAKTKAEAWQATCLSLSFKSDSESLYSLLRSVAGTFSFSFSPNFLNCFFSKESASVFAGYLRSHFPFPSQTPCVAEPKAACPSSNRPHALRSLIHRSALPSLSLILSRLPHNSPSPLPLTQSKLPLSC